MDRLYIIGAAILLIVLAGGGGVAWGWHKGAESERAEQIVKQEDEARAIRREAFQVADRLLTDLSKLKGNYDYVVAERDHALSAKFTCPASGKIGDIVVPIEVVRSMFNVRSPAGTARPPATRASAPLR
jgi:hypothetical protein